VSDLKVFRLTGTGVQLIPGSSVAVEKSLQTLIEKHLEEFLGVRMLASEFTTTKPHGGRIDTLGIDETDSPVIIEYKRALNENVISQGLFYLDWLMDHRADFKLLVMDKIGTEAAANISWLYPRLICIASDFTKYDQYAVQQIPRNIDLIRYSRHGDDLIILEQISRSVAGPADAQDKPRGVAPFPGDSATDSPDPAQTSDEYVQRYSQEMQDWFHLLRSFILGLGSDVEERVLPQYIAFRRFKTFAYFNFLSTRNAIAIEVPLSHGVVPEEPGFTEYKPRGYVRIWVDSAQNAERAQGIIAMSYEGQ
jgi:predicted transport protein